MPEASITVSDAEEALGRLRGVVRRTPTLPSSSEGLFLKAECLQVTGSFKVRPAYNQIAMLSESVRAKGIVTSSSGNFAQAAAYAARLLGTSSKIVMMRSSNPLKVERTRTLGGTVVFCEDRFEARSQMVDRIISEEHRHPIHPYDDAAAIAANGTISLELLEQIPEVRHIVVPVSGGGLIAGIALVAKEVRPAVRVWGVQAEGSNATHLSFRQGTPRSIEKAETIADGLTVTRPGRITFPLIQRFVDDVVTVQEETILGAVRHFLEVERLVVEPSGAVPLAAALEGKVPVDNTVLVLSGGNVAPKTLKMLFEEN